MTILQSNYVRQKVQFRKLNEVGFIAREVFDTSETSSKSEARTDISQDVTEVGTNIKHNKNQFLLGILLDKLRVRYALLNILLHMFHCNLIARRFVGGNNSR